MRLTLKTPPDTEPVSLAEVRQQLRLASDYTTDDALLAVLIAAARRRAELLTHRAIITQTWTMYLDGFPAAWRGNHWAEIALPKGSLASVSSIKYVDTDGTEQTLDASAYVVDTSGILGRVYPAPDQEWPDTDDRPNAVEIEFVCGQATAPEDIKLWLLLRIATAYENAEAVTVGQEVYEMPRDFVDGLLDAWRIPVVV